VTGRGGVGRAEAPTSAIDPIRTPAVAPPAALTPATVSDRRRAGPP
jgi:hypothetical protein